MILIVGMIEEMYQTAMYIVIIPFVSVTLNFDVSNIDIQCPNA